MTEPLSKMTPPTGTDAPTKGTKTRVVEIPRRPHLDWRLLDYDAKLAVGGDIFLPGLWRRMHDDGTFQLFFHEGPEMNFWQFVSSLSDPNEKVQLVIGFDEEQKAVEHAGLVILNRILVNDKIKRACGNFLFFREYWHREDSLELGWVVLNNWFGVHKADTIAGTTPNFA